MSVLFIFKFVNLSHEATSSLCSLGQSGGGRTQAEPRQNPGRTQAEPDTLLDTAAKELSPSAGHMRELLTQNCCLNAINSCRIATVTHTNSN